MSTKKLSISTGLLILRMFIGTRSACTHSHFCACQTNQEFWNVLMVFTTCLHSVSKSRWSIWSSRSKVLHVSPSKIDHLDGFHPMFWRSILLGSSRVQMIHHGILQPSMPSMPSVALRGAVHGWWERATCREGHHSHGILDVSPYIHPTFTLHSPYIHHTFILSDPDPVPLAVFLLLKTSVVDMVCGKVGRYMSPYISLARRVFTFSAFQTQG